MFSLVLALATALPSPSPVPQTVNLPAPIHSCAFLVGAAGLDGHEIDTEAIGHLYATSLRAQGVADAASKVTAQEMVQAFSDLMGCFVRPPEAKKP